MKPVTVIRACLHAHISRFRNNRQGAVAVAFALMLMPMVGAIGVALDFSRANSLRGKIQAAADTAALAAGKHQVGTEADRRTIAEQVFAANAEHLRFTNNYTVTYRDLDDGAAGQVEATARIETTISAILGIDHLDVHVLAQTGLSGGSLEIVMVMDNSGSMSGNRISTLERAARDLVTNLFGQETIHPTITIGIVPFAATVNVGTGYRNASWMDRDGLSSIHFNNFDSSQKTRFELFDDLDNVTWGGCVEARPYPLDVNDTPASAAQPDTLFVPLFAPDAPDTDPGWGYDDYINDYISDTGGSCDSGSGSNGGKSGKKGKGNNGGGGNSEELTDRERQERICKYDGASASTQLSYGTRKGPNMLCDSPELTPLTNRKSDLISAIARLGAYGGTNIHAGIMWGWRVLSPGTPLTQARDYDEPRNQKIMIVMTDGTNFHGSYDNMNGSWYSAYGYEWEDRLGSGLNTTSKLVGAMNTRTLEACTNAKAAGISIYTIAFDVDDRDTRTMMKECASSPVMFYKSDSTNDLVEAFESISKKLGELRLAR